MSAAEPFCEQCGARLTPTAVFCGSCGRPTGRGAKPAAGPPQGQVPPPPRPVGPPAGPPPGAVQGAGASAPPPGPPPGWGAPPPVGAGAPQPPYGPPPGPPPGAAVAAGGAATGRPSVASQLPSLAQLAKQADYVAIIGGVVVAFALVLPVYGGYSQISGPILVLLAPLLLAAGPIIIGFLRRGDLVGTQFAMAIYIGFGALQATTYWGYLLYGLTAGGFNGFGPGSLVGGIGSLIVIAAGVALLRTNPVR